MNHFLAVDVDQSFGDARQLEDHTTVSEAGTVEF